MSNPALSSRNAAPETSTGRPRASVPVSANALLPSDGGPLQRSASSSDLSRAGKLENLPDSFAGLSPEALKFEASIVLAGMEKLTQPAEAASLGERLGQKFNTSDKITEAGAIGFANFQVSALLGELRSRPLPESLPTLTKLSGASDKYADALLHYPPDKLGDGMKLSALNLNNEIQTAYTKTSFRAKAQESGRSLESIAAEALSAASSAGPAPSPEVLAAFVKMMQD